MSDMVELAAILTGGAAKRMGGRKADLPVAGVSMSERVLESVGPFAREVVCVGHVNPLEQLGVAAVGDLFPGKSSLGGIATALEYALKKNGPDAWVLCVGCDMPLINPKVLELLVARRAGCNVVMPVTEMGPEPLCALYRAGFFDTVKGQIEEGNLRILDLLEATDACRVYEDEIRRVDPELISFINVNRPADLKRVEGLLKTLDKT
jgi:molybdopterin-guanine dinucleotide biosynthesis protein A